MDKYQRFSKEWSQVVRIRFIKANTFKEAGEVLGSSNSTVIHRFKEAAKTELISGVSLPKAIAIDEYKGDTDAGTYQLFIANAETHEPIDILPNRRKETVKDYLSKMVPEIVVMDMNPSFKEVARKALGQPLIVADRFHYCRYIYWALDEVRRQVQKEWHEYDRKKCKRMRHVFYKRQEKLTKTNAWYLGRYTNMSETLKQAHELKEAYCKWFDWAKETKDLVEVKK